MDNFEPPPIPGETGSPSNAFVHVLNEQVAGGFTYTPTPTLAARVPPRLSRTEAGKEPPGVGGPTMLELYGITGLPTDPRFAGGLTEQGVTGWTTWGRQNSNPQFQDPSVFNPRINYSWIMGPPELQDRLRVPGDQHADRRLQPEVRPRHLRRPVQPPGRRGGRPGDLQPRRLHVRRCATRTRSSTRSSPTCASGCTSATCRTTSRSTERLTLNLGLRYEFATPQWEKDNFLTNFDPATNTLIQAKDGSIYDRALVNPDRNNFAPRLGAA